jgi:N-sulfoglucosamine sulfohydrolase
MAVERPNIVMVHCHDLGQYLGCYGVRTVQSPNLDAFAAGGVRFSRSFCTAPSCSPSRASIFTGRYPHSNGMMGLAHAGFAWDLHPTERHLAQYLAGAGYATTAVGVVHETASGAARCGYQRHIEPGLASDAASAAIDVLQAARDLPGPFFLSVGFVEPHRLPYPASEEWLPGEHGLPGPHLEPDDALGVEVPGYLRDTPATRRELAGLQGAVRHVDREFGRILAALEAAGLAQETLVLFTSDHGVAMPRAKCSLYDPGIEVPLILRLPCRPGWSGGRELSPLVSNIDTLPTLLDLVGLETPTSVQGRSLAPLLDGGAYTPRDAIFAEMTYHDYYDPRRCVRTDTHKLIANFTTAPSFMDPSQQRRQRSDTVVPACSAVAYHDDLELYDLTTDRWEQRDVAQEPAETDALRALSRRLYEHLTVTADPILKGAVTSPHHRRALTELRGAAT